MNNKRFLYSYGKITKSICPMCNSKSFNRMYNVETNVISEFGCCARKDKCGYVNPVVLGTDNIVIGKKYTPPTIEIIQKYFLKEYMDKTLKYYENNVLVRTLSEMLPNINVFEKAFKIGLGTCKNGGAVYWNTDFDNKIWNAKIVFYDGIKRDKILHPKSLKKVNDGFKRCFFGTLVFNSNKKTILVESEKTAFLGYLLEDKYNYLAYGGANGLTLEFLMLLKNNGINSFYHYYDCDKAGREARFKCEKNCQAIGIKVISCSLESFYNEDTGEEVSIHNALIFEKKDKYSLKENIKSSKEPGYDLGDFLIEKYYDNSNMD